MAEKKFNLFASVGLVQKTKEKVKEEVQDSARFVGSGLVGIAKNITEFSEATINQAPVLINKGLGLVNLDVDEVPAFRLNFDPVVNSLDRFQDKIVSDEEETRINSADFIPKDFTSLEQVRASSEKFQKTLFEAAASYIPALVGAKVGGKVGGVATAFALNASANYQDLKERFPEDVAIQKAIGYAMIQAPLEYLPIGDLMSHFGKKAGAELTEQTLKQGIFKTLKHALAEGGTEALQQSVLTIARIKDKTKWNEWKDAFFKDGGWKEIVAEGVFGGILGGTAGLAIDVVGSNKKVTVDNTDNEVTIGAKPVNLSAELNSSNPTPPTTAPKEAGTKPAAVKTNNLDITAALDSILNPTDSPTRTLNLDRLGPADVQAVTAALEAHFEKQGLVDQSVLDVKPDAVLEKETLEHKQAIIEKFENDTGAQFKHLLDEVRETGMSLKKLDSKLQTYATVVKQGNEAVDAFIKRFDTESSNITAQEWLQFEGIVTFLAEFEPTMLGVQSDMGRGLRTFGLPISDDTTLDLRTADLSQFLPNGDTVNSAVDKAVLIRDTKKRMEDYINKVRSDKKSRVKRAKEINEKGNFGSAYLAFVQANLLSATPNRLFDIGGSITQIGLKTASDYVAALMPSFGRSDKSRTRTLQGVNARVARDLVYISKAPFMMADGMRKMFKAFSEGGFTDLSKYFNSLSDSNRADQGQRKDLGLSQDNVRKLINNYTPDINKVRMARRKNVRDMTMTDMLYRTWGLIADNAVGRAAGKTVEQTAAAIQTGGFGIIQVVDKFFMTMILESEIQGLIVDQAHAHINQGILPQSALKPWVSNMSNIVETFMNTGKMPEGLPASHSKIIKEIIKQATGESKRSVFKQPLHDSNNKAVDAAGRFNDWLNTGGFPMAFGKAHISPFVPTAVNLVREAGLHLPALPLAVKNVRNDMMGRNGREAQDLAIARQVVGLAIMGLSYWLSSEDELIGNFLRGERESRSAAGDVEGSINLFGQQVQIRRLQPLAFLIIGAADLQRVIKERFNSIDPVTNNEALGMAIHAVGKVVLDNTFTKQLGNLINAVGDNDSSRLFEIMRDIPEALVPLGGLGQTINRLNPWDTDPVLRDLRKWSDGVKGRIPGKPGDTAPPRRDVLGKPIVHPAQENYFDTVLDFFNVRRSRGEVTPGRKVMAELGINTRELENKIRYKKSEIELTDEEHQRLLDILHEKFSDKRKGIDARVTSRSFGRLGRIEAKEKLQNYISRTRREAKLQLMDERKEIFERLKAKHLDRIRINKSQTGKSIVDKFKEKR